jgi:DNA polymerase III delta prime subunit
MENIANFVWTFKYAPQKLNECILPSSIKENIKTIISRGAAQNMILTGPAGCGKTTIAKMIVKEMGADCLFINASMNGNIDTLRTDIKNFASNKSFNGGRKYVILDEADYMNKNSTQPALRAFIEENIKNCGFIFTCNKIDGIIGPLHSRSVIIDFDIPSEEYSDLAMQFYKRCENILQNEGISFKTKYLQTLIAKFFPDYRRMINEMQFYSSSGTLDVTKILANNDNLINELIPFLKKNDFTEIRNFVSRNMDNIPGMFNFLYENLTDKVVTNNIPDLILILSKYQYQAAFVSSQEINTAACLTELMTLEYV